MGFLSRLLGNKAPSVPAGASVLIEDRSVPGRFGSTYTFRVYYVMLDAQGNETGDRHYLGQTFQTNEGAEAYRTAVADKTALPDYPVDASV